MCLTGYHTNPNAMTVDKILPALGYIKTNIVLCCSIFNRMKQNFNYEEFLAACEEIIKYSKQTT
jgi:hypothetical protein